MFMISFFPSTRCRLYKSNLFCGDKNSVEKIRQKKVFFKMKQNHIIFYSFAFIDQHFAQTKRFFTGMCVPASATETVTLFSSLLSTFFLPSQPSYILFCLSIYLRTFFTYLLSPYRHLNLLYSSPFLLLYSPYFFLLSHSPSFLPSIPSFT